MGYNTSTWGSIAQGQTLTTGIIWSPWNAAMTGGVDQGAQINLAGPENPGSTIESTDQIKQLNPDGTVAYWVTLTCTQASVPAGGQLITDFILQGGGF